MQKHKIHHLVITLLAALFFIPFLGSVHLFDWDEINFAECAREMVVTGDYSHVQLNFHPFWEKPPLFIWMQALSMNLFGINEFAARFPNAICGIVTLNVLYAFGRKLYNERFGIIWALVYGATFLSHFYFKSGIMDPWFNLFMFIALYYCALHTNNPVGRYGYITAVVVGLSIGLAVLTKGPVALLIVGLSAGIFWMSKRFAALTQIKFLLVALLAFLVSGFGWFLIEILRGNGVVINEFIVYQIRLFQTKDAGHGGFLMYHFVVLLIGCFPSSLFFIASHKKSLSDTPFQRHVKRWMLVLFWVVLILFTIVKTKIVHYSSMCYFPLSFLAAYTFYKFYIGEWQVKRWMKISGLVLVIVLGMVFTMLPLIDVFKNVLIEGHLIKDKFANEALKAKANWLGIEWIFGLMFLVGGIYFWIKISQNKAKIIYTFYGLCLFTITALSVLIVPRVEEFSQNAAIEFFEKYKNKDVYIETAGYKSYAHLFYSNKKPELNSPSMLNFIKVNSMAAEKEQGHSVDFMFNQFSLYWMCHEKIDKPVLISIKINDADGFATENKDFKELYRKNGFVFFERLPQ